LKEERVANRFPVAANQRSFFSHSVPRLICIEPEQIAFSILISCGAIVTQENSFGVLQTSDISNEVHSGEESATRGNWNMGASPAGLFRE
jgi:hypothetical protein